MWDWSIMFLFPLTNLQNHYFSCLHFHPRTVAQQHSQLKLSNFCQIGSAAFLELTYYITQTFMLIQSMEATFFLRTFWGLCKRLQWIHLTGNRSWFHMYHHLYPFSLQFRVVQICKFIHANVNFHNCGMVIYRQQTTIQFVHYSCLNCRALKKMCFQ